MIRSFVIAATVLLGAGASGVAHAEILAGRCWDKAAAQLNGKIVKGHTLSCAKGTWTQLGGGADTSDVNAYVTFYNWEGKSADNSVQVLFRPRKSSECLVAVTQPNGAVHTVSSHNCDTDYKTGKTLSVISDTDGHSVSGQLATTSKKHNFTSVYRRGSELGITGDNTFYLVGHFVEDK